MKHAELALKKSRKVAAPDAAFDFSGLWSNELESSLNVTVTGNAVTGTYISGTSEAGGPTPPFPIVGTVSGDLISWTVNWGIMISSWVGHGVIDKQGNRQILTMWYIIQTVADETDPEMQWKTVLTGADQFSK